MKRLLVSLDEREVRIVEPSGPRRRSRLADMTRRRSAEDLLEEPHRLDESLQVDTTALVFRSSITGKRAYALANLRFKEGRYQEARSELLALLASHPRDVPGHRMLKKVDEILAR